MFAAASKYSPFCNICTVCSEKLEKVVKPPHNPTARSKFQLPPKHTDKMPITSEPSEVTVSVATHDESSSLAIKSVTIYRNALPAKPPIPTIKMFFSIVMKKKPYE